MRVSVNRIGKSRDDSFDEERFWPRFKCNLTTQMYDDSETLWNCRIVDMSESGLGITTDAKLQRGKRVHLVDPKVKADVVWFRDKRAGLVLID